MSDLVATASAALLDNPSPTPAAKIIKKTSAPKISKPKASPAPGTLTITLDASTVSILRFALEEGKRTGVFPSDYTLSQMAIDSAFERGYLLAHEAIGIELDYMHLTSRATSIGDHLVVVEW